MKKTTFLEDCFLIDSVHFSNSLRDWSGRSKLLGIAGKVGPRRRAVLRRLSARPRNASILKWKELLLFDQNVIQCTKIGLFKKAAIILPQI